MASHSDICTCTVNFTGPPEGLPKKLAITMMGSDRGVDTNSIDLPSEVLPDDLLLAFSKLDPFTFSFPRTFFDQNSGIYQRNVEGFLTLLRLCLQRPVGESQSLRVNERKSNTQEDDLSANSAPNGSEDRSGYGNVSIAVRHVYM